MNDCLFLVSVYMFVYNNNLYDNVDLQDYLKPIQNKEVSIPAELEGKEMMIFGNVHQIYDWHKE